MRHRARLEVLLGAREARAVVGALRPSNVRLPEGMRIAMGARRGRLEVRIGMRDGLFTLLSTLNELLAEAEAAWRALLVAKEAKLK
ncbi:MAG: hypothetical protein C4339_01460 [Nitrososphaerota archaeon]